MKYKINVRKYADGTVKYFPLVKISWVESWVPINRYYKFADEWYEDLDIAKNIIAEAQPVINRRIVKESYDIIIK